ncbi:MAG TPA: hypothetical protein VKE40_20570 [Gemmataceae bacterium]|nr:hypothetical protein [Gemmataceae bacterium]
MLLIGLGIGLIVVGIVAIVRGRIQLSKSRAVVGIPARLLGVGFLFPFPLGFLAALIYTVANVPDATRPDVVEKWTKEHEWALTGIQAGVMIGLAVVLVIIAAMAAKPVTEIERGARRKRIAEYDDEVEEDRRRRRRTDDLDDRAEGDRPRRRRDDYDDEDEPRPRRRRDED